MILQYKEGYTHAGKFHADDVFSAAFLRILDPNFKITRVFEVSEKVLNSSDILVFDIGRGEFDHHQNGARVRENGVQYAAFGLLWEKFGRLIFEDEHLWKKFDDKFVQPIDKCDNTGDYHQLSFIIGSFNPLWNEDVTENEQFEKAVTFAKSILEREFARRKAVGAARDFVKKAFEESDGKVIYLERYAPWKTWLLKTEAKFVIFPSDRGGYNAVCVPVSESENSPRIPFPSKWSSLENKELENVSNIEGLTFCHKNCFLIHTKSLESAKKATKAAIENFKNINNTGENK